jgi:FAD/FMN-containing dehydrogenase
MSQTTIAALKAIVGDAHVKTDPADLETWGQDWTRFFRPAPLAIILPKTLEEVQAIVRFANETGLALVPSGGRTGLSGGAVAENGELVVSFDRMNRIRDFNPVDRTVVCEAGVVTAQLQAFAREQGLFYPVDFASAGSSQIGGNIATNAGGINVIKYGMTRDWVAGLRVVTGSGELMNLNAGLVKNNTGYDFRHLFIGSEGTLGLIVEATMRLTTPPAEQTVMVLGVMFRNLIDNAIRYAGDHARIQASILKNKDSIQVRVSDNGPNIGQATRTRIFEKFYRGRSSQGDGAGLGLSICSDIATLHSASLVLLPRDQDMNSFLVTFREG